MKALIASLLLPALLCPPAAVNMNHPDPVEVIVEVEPSCEVCLPLLAGQLPDAGIGYCYDLLLDGFQLTLPASQLWKLEALSFVRAVYPCAEYESCSTITEVFDASAYQSAAGMLGIDTAELDGSGITVAILDTGFDITHPAFADPADPFSESLTFEGLETHLGSRLLKASHAGLLSADDLYHSAQIPFCFDYHGRDTDLSGAAVHGTHVAGIIGANKTADSSFTGIAPGCQLLLMKVFDDAGSAATDSAIIAAIEDAIRLGADIINLSLGDYAGSANPSQNISLSAVIERARQSGVLIVCSAGNESTSASASRLADEGITLPPADYTDYGTISYPASADYTVAAASADNIWSYQLHFYAADPSRPIFYTDTNKASGVLETSFADAFHARTLEYAVIPGIGEDGDYTGIPADGKLVLVNRGTIPFTEKAAVAAAHGAIGMIVCDNTDDPLLNMELTGSPIPAIFISREDGLALAGASDRRVTFHREYSILANTETAGQISAFSSFGPTPSLTLKPDITAVGGHVWSTVSGGYASASGTSMAAPQISAAAALLLQDLNLRGEISDPSRRAEQLRIRLMNAAVPILQDNGTEYSPRVQGAGLLNLASARANLPQLTHTPSGKPKAELYDQLGDSFSLSLTLTNPTQEPMETTLGVSLLHDGWEMLTLSDNSERAFASLISEADKGAVIRAADYRQNLNRNADDYSPLSIMLAPGEETIIELTVTPDPLLTKELEAVFPNGYYREGFVYCETAGQSVSLPFMGYAGKWDAAPILDGNLYEDEFTLFGGIKWVLPVNGTLIPAGQMADGGLDAALIAFSPNGDGNADELYLIPNLLRNAAKGTITVTDSSGRVVCREDIAADYLTKSAGMDAVLRLPIFWGGSDGLYRRYILPDGRYTVAVTLTPDYPGAAPQTLTFPVLLDTEKPVIRDMDFNPDTRRLTLTLRDNAGLLQAVLKENQHPDSFTATALCDPSDPDTAVTFDLSGFGGDVLYCELTDLARNTRILRLVLSKEEIR